MTAPFPPLEAATTLADELLFPTALATDAADLVPRSHLDALAGAGLYGLPRESDEDGGGAVVETLAGGCLTTAFVWIQHQGARRILAGATAPGLWEAWSDELQRGKCRAGIAIAGIRPSAAGVTARAVAGGWRVNGDVPWVTGWGRIDVVVTAARDHAGDIVWTLIDAVESPTLTVERQHLVAVNASGTVVVRFRDHFVAAERTIAVQPYDEWAARDARGGRGNGSLALGVAGRCCRLLGPTALDADLEIARDRLDQAGPGEMAAARADASALAARAAAALVVTAGSRAVLLDQHPQRLAREALFLLVFASRPGIRTALKQRFDRAG